MGNEPSITVTVAAMLEFTQALSGLGNEVRILRGQVSAYEQNVLDLRNALTETQAKLAKAEAASKQATPAE